MNRKSHFRSILVVSLIAIFILIVPIIINEIYKYGDKHGGYETLWGVPELLTYYGTLLGSAATIIAVVLTIHITREISQKERKHSENINHRNTGMQICFGIIESCEIKKVVEIIDELKVIMTAENLNKQAFIEEIKNKFLAVSDEVNKSYLKFQFVYPTLCPFIDTYIKGYIDKYAQSIRKVGNSFKIVNSMIEFDINAYCF